MVQRSGAGKLESFKPISQQGAEKVRNWEGVILDCFVMLVELMEWGMIDATG